jgi:hypothetical protein
MTVTLNSAITWMRTNPLLSLAIVVGAWWLWNIYQIRRKQIIVAIQPAGAPIMVERFSSCLQKKQIYLNSCSPDEPTSVGDVNLEKRYGKFYLTINANLPYAEGGDFHSIHGAYNAFLVSTSDNESLNIGTLVRHGDRWYKLSTELLGEYDKFDRIDVYRQTETYEPKRVLTGSIVAQNCSN